jgi:hypothetical protein
MEKMNHVEQITALAADYLKIALNELRSDAMEGQTVLENLIIARNCLDKAIEQYHQV